LRIIYEKLFKEDLPASCFGDDDHQRALAEIGHDLLLPMRQPLVRMTEDYSEKLENLPGIRSEISKSWGRDT